MSQAAKGHDRSHGGEDELMFESKKYGYLQQEWPEVEAAKGLKAMVPMCLEES